MPDPRAQRTLVKSPPELWAEVSDAGALARHLGDFGAIRITRLDPETTVAWEGDRVRGTVELEASGWGTRVTLTATGTASVRLPGEEELPPAAAFAPVAAPLPGSGGARRRPSLLALFRRRTRDGAPPLGAAAVAPHGVSAPPEPSPSDGPDPKAAERILAAALDELGSASRRPYLRA